MGKFRTKTTAWLFVLLFIGYYISHVAFMHIHYVDGVSIVHSHPFSHSHGHTHSSLEIASLDRFTYLNSLSYVSCSFLPVLYSTPYEYSLYVSKGVITLYYTSCTLRGPPCNELYSL